MQNGRVGTGLHEGPQKGEYYSEHIIKAQVVLKLPRRRRRRRPNHKHLIESRLLLLLLPSQEDELRMSGDPRYSHLLEDLHVEISTFAAPAEAHARIAYALAEVRRFLVPVSERIKQFVYTSFGRPLR